MTIAFGDLVALTLASCASFRASDCATLKIVWSWAGEGCSGPAASLPASS